MCHRVISTIVRLDAKQKSHMTALLRAIRRRGTGARELLAWSTYLIIRNARPSTFSK